MYRNNAYRRAYSSSSRPAPLASRRLTIVLLLLLFSLGSTALPGETSTVTTARGAGGPGGPIQGITGQAARQMNGLIREKLSWTSAQRKIDSQLIFESKKQKNQPIADGISTLDTGIELDQQGRVLVDIKASAAKLVEPVLAKLGAEVTSLFPRDIRAHVPLSAIEDLAATPEVIYIMPAATYMTNVTNVSEGDTTHGAALARSIFPSANGTGVNVGVLSDGVDSLAAIQATGDLPAVTVLSGQAGSGDEGTAMLEIVHDLAPNAQLFFATARPNPVQFAQNIRDLRTAGCDIIIDDFTYFVETPFQNGQAASVTSPTNGGVVIEAVNDVTASGALFFSSAANSGNLDDGTGGVWEGDFVDGGAAPLPIPPGFGNLHNFGGQTFDVLTAGTRTVNLKWSDPLGGSSNDYDLYLLSSDGTTLIAASQNIQNGTQDPFEQISNAIGFAANSRLVIVRFSGAGRFLHLNTNRGRLSIATSGVTFGHNSCANGYSVAAAPANNPVAPGNPSGPFPGLFTSSQLSELFTSDGPRRIFFNADSSAITPGNFSSTGGQLLQKPDITAADGVMCAAPGFNPFFGTSASAPHAGAIAALIKSFNPELTPAQIKTILTSTAIDIEAAGWDRDTGFGIVMANQALASLCSITCPANITQTNDPNQCGAVVAYAPTTMGGSCGTVNCGPPSGSFFPVGVTTVTCTTTAGPACTFTVTVQDTQPPSITCPPNQTAVTDQNTCPAPACQTVNFPPPTASDNCPGVIVVCNPPSGSCFPIGTTTVTCTATDASGNTSNCSFTVTTFDTALQDDSNPNTILLWNSLTGQYRFCCNGITFTGVGTSIIKGCVFTLQHNPADRRVLGLVDKSVHRGTASIQAPPGTIRCTITDRNTLNDTNVTSCQ
jgi:HYR domain/Subtilase family